MAWGEELSWEAPGQPKWHEPGPEGETFDQEVERMRVRTGARQRDNPWWAPLIEVARVHGVSVQDCIIIAKYWRVYNNYRTWFPSGLVRAKDAASDRIREARPSDDPLGEDPVFDAIMRVADR